MKQYIRLFLITTAIAVSHNGFPQTSSPEKLDPLEKSWPPINLPAAWPEPIHDNRNYLFFQADRFETGFSDDNESYNWDAQGWYGNDYHKLWIKSETEGLFSESPESLEFQALYSRLLTPFWDLQAGVRYDFQPGPERAYAVLGIQGMAPYFMEIDAATFISEKGDVLLRAEMEYEILLAQRLILQPRFEFNLAAQNIPESGIGKGLSSTELGVRLRYEFKREIAPYIGISWGKTYGETATIVRADGESSSQLSFLLGLRLWY